jgi:hypothetical protein
MFWVGRGDGIEPGLGVDSEKTVLVDPAQTVEEGRLEQDKHQEDKHQEAG